MPGVLRRARTARSDESGARSISSQTIPRTVSRPRSSRRGIAARPVCWNIHCRSHIRIRRSSPHRSTRQRRGCSCRSRPGRRSARSIRATGCRRNASLRTPSCSPASRGWADTSPERARDPAPTNTGTSTSPTIPESDDGGRNGRGGPARRAGSPPTRWRRVVRRWCSRRRGTVGCGDADAAAERKLSRGSGPAGMSNTRSRFRPWRRFLRRSRSDR